MINFNNQDDQRNLLQEMELIEIVYEDIEGIKDVPIKKNPHLQKFLKITNSLIVNQVSWLSFLNPYKSYMSFSNLNDLFISVKIPADMKKTIKNINEKRENIIKELKCWPITLKKLKDAKTKKNVYYLATNEQIEEETILNTLLQSLEDFKKEENTKWENLLNISFEELSEKVRKIRKIAYLLDERIKPINNTSSERVFNAKENFNQLFTMLLYLKKQKVSNYISKAIFSDNGELLKKAKENMQKYKQAFYFGIFFWFIVIFFFVFYVLDTKMTKKEYIIKENTINV